jgi:hypothetical protein
MLTNPKSPIQELYNRALAVSDRDQIEPILAELRIALQEKIQSGETWIAERAGGGAGSQEAFGTGERNQPSLRSAREAIGGTCRAQAAG